MRCSPLILLCFCFCLLALVPDSAAKGDPGFQRWLADFTANAAGEGIGRSTLDLAFAGIDRPDEEVLRKARYQPEFTQEIWDYLDARVNPKTIARGREMAALHRGTLAAIERRFGVEAEVILAIWSMESAYGAALERPERLHYVPQALATLAYADKRRAKYAQSQLMAALRILDSGDITREQLTGSWAGAMGQTQFIPTSFLAYAVDMNGDGRRDIWHSVDDALATAANLLYENGWRTGRTWGYEAVTTRHAVNQAGQTRTLGQWQQAGVGRPGDRTFPRLDERAELLLPAGAKGPAFLLLRNFFILKRYNNADTYALAVGMLADRLAGHAGLVQPWPRPAGALSAEDKFELQHRLKERGLYDGEIDGDLGAGTKEAIRRFQAEKGMPADGAATTSLLHALRQ